MPPGVAGERHQQDFGWQAGEVADRVEQAHSAAKATALPGTED